MGLHTSYVGCMLLLLCVLPGIHGIITATISPTLISTRSVPVCKQKQNENKTEYGAKREFYGAQQLPIEQRYCLSINIRAT